MINLYVFRHGQSVYQCLRVISGINEYGLSALGKYQTYNLAIKNEVDFEVAYISDTKRTRETFQTLQYVGITPPSSNCIYTPLIREKCQGIYTMQDFKFFPDDPNNRQFTPEGGESWSDIQERVTQTFGFLVRRYLFKQLQPNSEDSEEVKELFKLSENIQTTNNNILLVTHYGFIKEMVHFLKKDLNQPELEQPYFAQNATLFTVQLCQSGENDWTSKIISFNSYTRQLRPFMHQ